MSFCVSMFYRLWWRWGHLTWWGWSCVAEGHERGWLKENGPHPVHRPHRLLNLCLQHEIKLAMCAGLWGGNTHSSRWSCCSGHSTLSALDRSSGHFAVFILPDISVLLTTPFFVKHLLPLDFHSDTTLSWLHSYSSDHSFALSLKPSFT